MILYNIHVYYLYMNTSSTFRNFIHTRDKSCLITKLNVLECDCAHIIPSYICEKYANKFMYDKNNGLLLCKNLHNLFDKFIWTFDIYDINYDTQKHKYSCRIIIISNNKNLSINEYKNKYVDIPIECYPFLYCHYQMFIAWNFDNDKNIDQLYKDIILDDRLFIHLYSNTLPTDYILNKQMRNYFLVKELITLVDHDYFVNAILKHKSKLNKELYLVWFDYIPYIEASWEPIDNLKDNTIEAYHKICEVKEDNDFV